MSDEPRPSLLRELQRRRVFRVATVYIVVAWVVIQAAETILPRLGLPGWSVTLVIALLGLGLPVAIALAWVFDVTPAGIGRTPPAVLATPLAPGTPHRRARAVAYLAIALLALPAAWLLLRAARGTADDLDPMRVAILPFRVVAAGSDLVHLREGLPELLVSAMSSDRAPSAVPIRALLAAMDRQGGRTLDPTAEQATELARELGAGVALLGEVVQRSGQLVVTASIVDTRSGKPGPTLRVSAHADSLHALVDRLTNQIVAALGGTPQHRLAAITSTSRTAIDEYLKGTEDYRKGRYGEAAAHFDRAVEIDSTFALAALWLRNAASWTGDDPPNTPRAARLAATYKHQLGDEDRLYLEALLGPDYPQVLPSHAELIALRERALRLNPQRAEFWYLAGDWLMHKGAITGRENALQQATEYFDEAIRIDSTYIEPLDHAATLAVAREDTEAFQRYYGLLMAVDSTSETMLTQRWNRHLIVDDETALTATELVELVGPSQANKLFWQAASSGFGLAELADVVEDNPAMRTPEAEAHRWVGTILAYLEGRPGAVAQFERELPNRDDAAAAAVGLHRALYWIPDTAEGDRQARVLESIPNRPPFPRCALSLWHARRGQQLAQAMPDTLAPDSATPAMDLLDLALCRQLVRTVVAVARGPADSARARLVALDAVLRTGPRVNSWLNEVANVEAARMWEVLGEPERALAAHRRWGFGEVEWQIPERLAEEGRLAEMVGDRAGAISAYQKYLRYRTRPEGPFIERANAVRARLATLTSER